jgi:OOP family OmpA-OmpF porin
LELFSRFYEYNLMRFYFVTFCLLLSQVILTQTAGNWKGLLYFEGQNITSSSLIYFEIPSELQVQEGRTREELFGSTAFVVKKTMCVQKNGTTVVTQQIIEKKKDVSGNRWCNAIFTLSFSDSSGYLTGSFLSSECNGKKGKVICIRSGDKMDKLTTVLETQVWRIQLIDDIKNNRKAPEVRAKERANFAFQPIFFDVDKAEIRFEFTSFLDKMVAVVLGHSDLRIMVIGHTDSDGSNAYNNALSERRAAAITAYFVAKGLAPDRIKIQFKGETEPIGNNTTSEGKQLNRRVDFLFI